LTFCFKGIKKDFSQIIKPRKVKKMRNFIKRRKWMIILLVAFIGLSSWYFINSREIEKEPEKADLVFLQFEK